jgi:Tfp pilus assembly protein PilO
LLIIALLIFVITKNGAYVAALLDVLDKSSKSHKEEVDTLNNLHNREIVEKNLILKEYQENLSKIEEEYAKKNEELDTEKKKELKKMVEEGYDDPEKLSREIARMFGLEHG